MSKNRGFSNKSYSPRDGNRNMNSAYETTGFKSSSHSNEGSSRNNYNSSRKYNEDDDDNNSSNFYNSRKETN